MATEFLDKNHIFSTKYLLEVVVMQVVAERECSAHLKYVGLTPRLWAGESNSSTSNGADDNVAS